MAPGVLDVLLFLPASKIRQALQCVPSDFLLAINEGPNQQFLEDVHLIEPLRVEKLCQGMLLVVRSTNRCEKGLPKARERPVPLLFEDARMRETLLPSWPEDILRGAAWNRNRYEMIRRPGDRHRVA
jgi:hypothetical protein